VEILSVKVRVKVESDNNKEEESSDDDDNEEEEELSRATSSASRTAGVCGAKTGLHPDGLQREYGG
jgi:hypothetical protein